MAAMISRRLSSRVLKSALSSTSSLYSHSAPWTTNAMTTPEFQPSRGTLLHGSTRFCTDLSSKLFHEKPRYFQSSHSKNQGSHLAKLKILDARFVLSSSTHNMTFGSRLSSAGNVRFFSTNEEPENPNQIPDSEELLNENSSSLGIGVSSTSLPILTLAVFWHVNKGIKEIMADYVHQEVTRNWILIYLRLFLLIVIKDVFLSLVF